MKARPGAINCWLCRGCTLNVKYTTESDTAMKQVLTLIGEFIAAASLFLIPVALSYLGCGLGYTCP